MYGNVNRSIFVMSHRFFSGLMLCIAQNAAAANLSISQKRTNSYRNLICLPPKIKLEGKALPSKRVIKSSCSVLLYIKNQPRQLIPIDSSWWVIILLLKGCPTELQQHLLLMQQQLQVHHRYQFQRLQHLWSYFQPVLRFQIQQLQIVLSVHADKQHQ